MEGALALRSVGSAPLGQQEEAAWVGRLKSDDREAFECIIGRYQAVVLAYGLRVLGQEAQARDLAQDVFVTFWNARHQYEDRGQLRAYLLGIARNRALAQLKRRRAGFRLEAVAAQVPLTPAETPLQQVEKAQDKLRLGAALAELDEDRAETIRLRFVLGLSLAEIAQVTGVAVGTVKSRIARGLAGLREELAGDE